MTKAKRSIRIQRILVALDASPASLAALRAAADLAARMEAELLGVFVEDINLLRLAQLPLAREISQFSAKVRELNPPRIERELRIQARRARQAMAQVAERRQLRWSFRVTRGEITPELLLAAGEADVIFLGKSGWSRRRGVGSTARGVLMDAPQLAMMLERGLPLGPVLVAYDGSEQSKKALRASEALVRRADGTITVLIVAEDEQDARRLQKEAAEELRERDLRARYRWLVRGDLPRLTDIIESEMSCVFVLSGEAPLPGGRPMTELLEGIDCPVLVVR